MKLLISILILSTSLIVKANICGTDYQSFNPTTSGVDFVTVHSSETLNPCYLNFGLFLNYSKNILTYTKDFTDANGNTFKAGQKPNDQITGMDLSVGFGLTQNWDIGLNVPFVLSQKLEDKNLTSSFTQTGATEIKLSTKYRLSGDDQGGYAVALGLNQNLIGNNPFTGKNPKPTFNFEVIGDWTLGDWATGLNLGYRWRNPGESILGVPFEPLDDQYIYSAATSYYFKENEFKLIFEIFGTQFVKESNFSSVKKPNALEWQVGFKKDLNAELSYHIGAGASIQSALGSPENRIYAGLNWSIGPICETTVFDQVLPEEKNQTILLNTQILFDTDSDKLRSEDIPELDKFFDNINRKKISKIEVQGHTDSVGSAEYNLDLSQRRAQSVVNYLIKKYQDFNKNKLVPIGYGEEWPIADNGNYQGRTKNRRVELKIEF